MARSRSAVSLPLTMGIAGATLVIATAILLGPAVLDCAQQSAQAGACLRGKIVRDGLVAPEPASLAAASSAESGLRPPGWIEANATEYEPVASGFAALKARPGRLDAAGALPRPEIAGDVALADPRTTIDAAGFVPRPRPRGEASLAPAVTGAIDASATALPAAGLAGAAAIVQPPPVPPPQASGRIGTAARGQGRASLAPQLVADLSPVPPLAEIAAPVAPKAPPLLAPAPPAATAAAALAAPDPPKYDPRYPNVLVLPPPNTGPDSSFATLELRSSGLRGPAASSIGSLR